SFLIPDSFEIKNYTRKNAKEILDQNPDLVAQGKTVDDLLKAPLNASWDGDGDSYPDRWISVEVTSDVPSGLPSPETLRSVLEHAGLREVKVKRAQVAHEQGLTATYSLEFNRDDGKRMTAYGTGYFFRTPKGFVQVSFNRNSPSDSEYDAMTTTMVGSLK